ncbi:MAG: protein kinase [Planctomycetes bacterium]|nr:protein kinase [Planctomycetota bacterium]
MNTVLHCPNQHTLHAFATGRLSEEDAEPVASHLTDCPACTSICDVEFAGVINLLRVPPTDNAVAPELPELLQRIRVDVSMRTPQVEIGKLASLPPPDDEIVQRILSRLSPPQEPGELGRIGKFPLLRVLGQGGMGVVFEGFDKDLHRAVAVKVIRGPVGETDTDRERFLREARAAAKLDHRNILQVFQIDTHEPGGVTYLVTPLLKGESLADRLRREPRLTINESLDLARQTAEGLAEAHAAGLVHRDIKPSNLWVEERTEGPSVRILDFGLAKPIDGSAEISQSGGTAGTPAYMAPEQWNGEPMDGRADLWALGVLLYEMITGRRPFVGATLGKIRTAALESDPIPPDSLVLGLPTGVCPVILGLLRKNPSDREPKTARDVVAALRALIGSASTAIPASGVETIPLIPTQPRLDSPLQKRRALVGLAVLLMLLAGVVILQQVIIRIKRQEGVPPIELSVPHGTKVKVDGKGEVDVTLPGGQPGELVPPIPKATGPTLDHFRRANIPDKFLAEFGRGNSAAAPPELVAMVGTPEQAKPNPGTGHAWAITCLALQPDGKTLVTTGLDGFARFWDLTTPTPTELAAVHAHKKPILALALSTDATRMATCDETGLIAVWDLPRRTVLATREIKGAGEALAFSPDGTLFAVGSWDEGAILIDPRDKNLSTVKRLTLEREGVQSLRFLPTGNKLVIGGRAVLKVVDLITEKPVLHQFENKVIYKATAVSSDGRWLAVNGGQNPLRPDTGAITDLFLRPSKGVKTEESIFGVRDAKNGFGVRQFLPHDSRVYRSAFSPDGKLLATVTKDGQLIVWQWADEKKVLDIPVANPDWALGPTFLLTDVVFHPDGRHVIVGTKAATTLIFRLPQ